MKQANKEQSCEARDNKYKIIEVLDGDGERMLKLRAYSDALRSQAVQDRMLKAFEAFRQINKDTPETFH